MVVKVLLSRMLVKMLLSKYLCQRMYVEIFVYKSGFQGVDAKLF